MDRGRSEGVMWQAESCHTAELLAIRHTFAGLDHANKFNIFFKLLPFVLPHISTWGKRKKKREKKSFYI